MTPWDRSNLLRRHFFCSLNRFVLTRTGKNLDCTFRVIFTLFFSSSSLHWPSNYSAIPLFFRILYSWLYIFLGFSILKYLFFIAFWVFCCSLFAHRLFFPWPKSRLVLFSSCKYNIIKHLKWQVWLLWTQWRERSRLCSSRRMTQRIELWFCSASWTMSASSGRKWDKSSYFFVLVYRLYTLRILVLVTSVNCSKKSSRAPLKTIILCWGEQWDLNEDVRLWNEGVGPKGQSQSPTLKSAFGQLLGRTVFSYRFITLPPHYFSLKIILIYIVNYLFVLTNNCYIWVHFFTQNCAIYLLSVF